MTDDEIRALLDGATKTAITALKLKAAWDLASAAPDLAAEVLRLRGYLREIEREEKPTSNATVKRMAWVARAALKGAAE